jgi:hypothetical protein
MYAGLLTALVLAVARYPGHAPLASASGRFVVANVELDQKTGRFPHALFVTERSSNARKLLLQYPREATVAWAPDRDALAVTTQVGSTQTTLTLFVVESGAAFRKLDVAEALYAAFPSLRGELSQYLHVHVELVAWHGGGAVDCQLRATAGNGPNISRRYAVTVDGQAKRR